jgi:hypothetical protein
VTVAAYNEDNETAEEEFMLKAVVKSGIRGGLAGAIPGSIAVGVITVLLAITTFLQPPDGIGAAGWFITMVGLGVMAVAAGSLAGGAIGGAFLGWRNERRRAAAFFGCVIGGLTGGLWLVAALLALNLVWALLSQ